MPRAVSENFAPYTSIGNMLILLEKIRKGWTPNQVDKGEMEHVGITAGNASRTISALEYLALINEDGKPTETWKAIATSTTNDYPKVLEGILRNAYPSIFELHPTPADATDIEIGNAFAKSEPLNQRARMVSLFRGLCQEAGLIAGDPLTRERKPVSSLSNKKASEKTNTDNSVNTEIAKSRFSPPDKINPSLKWYNDLETLLSRLPDPDNPKWTQAKKDSWLTALQSMLDLLIETTEESKP